MTGMSCVIRTNGMTINEMTRMTGMTGMTRMTGMIWITGMTYMIIG